MSVDHGLMILAGVAAIWFVMRFLYAPKGARGGLGSMFRREKAQKPPGIGIEALRSMVEDFETLVRQAESFRGLIIAGPFAARKADSESVVTAIIITTDLTGLEGPMALAGWPYPARGHEIRDRQVETGPGFVLHRLTMRGAPPVEIAFVTSDAASPAPLAPALASGAMPLPLGTRDAELLLGRWSVRTIIQNKKGEKP